MSELLDIFMPEDLCARCAVEEPTNQITLQVEREGEGAESCRLAFCSERCKADFIRGYWALQGTVEVEPS